MGMAHAAKRWTAQEVRKLPDDGRRYEVIDGELLVTPSPSASHQEVVRELIVEVTVYLRSEPVGRLFPAPSDVELDNQTQVQPDIYVRAALPPHPLVLAIEVVSPSTARSDRLLKRRLYQRAGVAEYWIADADSRTIERWLPGDDRPEIVSETMEWRPAGSAAPLRIDLVELFRRAEGPG